MDSIKKEKKVFCPYCTATNIVTESGVQKCWKCYSDIRINIFLAVEPLPEAKGEENRCLCCGDTFIVLEPNQSECNNCRFEILW